MNRFIYRLKRSSNISKYIEESLQIETDTKFVGMSFILRDQARCRDSLIVSNCPFRRIIQRSWNSKMKIAMTLITRMYWKKEDLPSATKVNVLGPVHNPFCIKTDRFSSVFLLCIYVNPPKNRVE